MLQTYENGDRTDPSEMVAPKEIDTSKTVFVNSSKLKVALYALCCVVTTLASLDSILNPQIFKGMPSQYFGWLGLVVFGLLGLPAVVLMTRNLGSKIYLSPTGYTDTSVSKAELPWHGISKVSVMYRNSGWSPSSPSLSIEVDESQREWIAGRRYCRFPRLRREEYMRRQLSIDSTRVDMNTDRFLNIFEAYVRDHNPSLLDDGQLPRLKVFA